MTESPITLYTVGHSNHDLETFLGLLRTHQIEVVVDTRSHPRSKFVPHFDVENLKPAIEREGMRFVFLGHELGGRPEGAQFYDENDHVLYDRIAAAPFFLSGLTKLEKGAARYRVAILCSCEHPIHCHRRLLIGRVLEQRGVQALHILSDGTLQTEAELQRAEAEDDTGQQSLFEREEVTPWRSTRSVSRRRPPNGSSAH
jgi:uncharacterized protein (DUF488 family)